jgi:hypothetical protein
MLDESRLTGSAKEKGPMIVTAERPAMAVPAMPRAEPDSAAARTLALAFLRYISACWRGEAGASKFATRLGAYWRGELPVLPRRAPDAFSPHGAAGRGIAWYVTADAVLGYVPGRDSGYRVPIGAVPGLAECVAAGPAERPRAPTEALWAAARRGGWHGAAA